VPVTKKPSERIAELQRLIVDELGRLDADDPARETTDFLMKISGTTLADLAEHRLKSPATLIAAVIAYLDERALNDTE
jgi:hypothetical protein